MKILAPLLGAAAIAGLPASADAQGRFDLITYDHARFDLQTLAGFGTNWGILVNTSGEPLALADWKHAPHFGRLSAEIGELDLFPSEPLAGLVLQPGEAIGSNDPLLTALLKPSETLVVPLAIVLTLQVKKPAPLDSTQTLDFCIQLGDELASATTQVDFASLGGPAIQKISAVRVESAASTIAMAELASGCSGSLEAHGIAPTGPTSVAASSDLAVLGNSNFGARIAGAAGQGFVLGIDFAPGSLVFDGCAIHLGLTPALATKVGVTSGAGYADVALPIPEDAVLAGIDVNLQALLLGDGEALEGVSNALTLILGTCP